MENVLTVTCMSKKKAIELYYFLIDDTWETIQPIKRKWSWRNLRYQYYFEIRLIG